MRIRNAKAGTEAQAFHQEESLSRFGVKNYAYDVDLVTVVHECPCIVHEFKCAGEEHIQRDFGYDYVMCDGMSLFERDWKQNTPRHQVGVLRAIGNAMGAPVLLCGYFLACDHSENKGRVPYDPPSDFTNMRDIVAMRIVTLGWPRFLEGNGVDGLYTAGTYARMIQQLKSRVYHAKR